jgi:hypothetical protein
MFLYQFIILIIFKIHYIALEIKKNFLVTTSKSKNIIQNTYIHVFIFILKVLFQIQNLNCELNYLNILHFISFFLYWCLHYQFILIN